MTNINTFQGDVFIPEYIKHTGDENNLFGFSGTDTFKIATAGSDRLTVGTDGSVTVAERLYVSEFIYHSGDDNTYIQFGADSIGLYAGGNHKLTVNATNTQFYSDIYMTQYMYHYSDNNTYFGFPANDTFSIVTNSTERFQIDASGRIYMGNRISGLNFPDVLTIADTRNADNWSVHNTMFKVCHKPNNQNNHYGLSFAVSATRGDGIIQTYNQNAGAQYDLLLNPQAGQVGVNTNDPQRSLDVAGIVRVRSNMGWSNQNAWSTNKSLQGPNAVYYGVQAHHFSTYSSRRFKENIKSIPDALHQVKKMRGVHFNWKQGQGDNTLPNFMDDYDRTELIKQQTHIGFIAEEVEEVFPTLVSHEDDGQTSGVDYSTMTPVLVNAIKELDDKIGRGEASSDDRLKDNETYIKNATKTIMKLKPQTYDKKESFTSNIYTHEAGLIAQDIWYDTPELRFVVKPGLLSQIPDDVPTRDDDPRVDPDYSKWGPNPASVDYNYIIPYALKSIQEIATELPKRKTQVIEVTPSNIDQYRSLTVCSDTGIFKCDVPVCSLSKKSYDINCFGVISTSNVDSIDNEILIDTHGPGKLWVINTSNILSGDYLTTSNIHGYSMKQNDDILHNYTVAKSTIDCDFIPTQINSKRIKQKLTNVTHYVKTDLYEIPKEEYDGIDDIYRTSNEYAFYTMSGYSKVSGKGGYDKLEYYKSNDDNEKGEYNIISIDEWTSSESNVQNTYSTYYSNLSTTEVSLEDYTALDEAEKSKCVYTTRTIYYYNVREESADPLPGFEAEIKQVYMNDLDENGQIQWEDTGETIEKYSIRYLDGSGNITDESNHVYKAALIGCTYNCT